MILGVGQKLRTRVEDGEGAKSMSSNARIYCEVRPDHLPSFTFWIFSFIQIGHCLEKAMWSPLQFWHFWIFWAAFAVMSLLTTPETSIQPYMLFVHDQTADIFETTQWI